MPVPGLSLLGPKRVRGFVSILRYVNPTIIIIIIKYCKTRHLPPTGKKCQKKKVEEAEGNNELF